MFEHLHTHSHYSLLDGLSTIRSLCEVALEMGQETVCLTDHGSVAGVPELFRTAVEYGLKPIAGMEAYFCEDVSVKDKTSKTYHLTLLAKNLDGYLNLCRLSTASYRYGFYGKPRIDLALLHNHRQGLIVLSGCMNSVMGQAIIAGDHMKAKYWLSEIPNAVGRDNFYLEYMDHGIPAQEAINYTLDRFRRKNHSLKAVVTQDSHYTFEGDANVHQTLLCIGTHSSVRAPSFKFDGGPYHYCDAEHLERKFGQTLIRSTVDLAHSMESYAIPRTGGMPVLPNALTLGKPAFLVLEAMAAEGLRKRKLRKGIYVKRLRHELEVVHKLKFDSYFIIIADILKFARNRRILVGPGRGSSAGSLLAYCLQITDVDPIRYQLYFERFLNEHRSSPPDIDVDVADTGRQEVLEYIRTKYGADKVAHIGSFSAMGPRQSIRDVALAHSMPYEQVNSALKEVGHNPMLKMEELLRMSAVTQGFSKEILDQAEALQGKYRHSSTHAAGIIIANHALDQTLPLVERHGVVQTQYDMEELDKLGYVKFDILGLKTLGVLSATIRKALIGDAAIKEMHALDDDKVYDLICSGRTQGVFQLEGWGYVKMIKRYRPRTFEDVMMINALYRPGPMQGGEGLETILRRRNGEERITYKHPDLEPILISTYGVPVFQEQVMQMCQVLAGFTLPEADQMRSAIGKKDEAKLEGMHRQFINGCLGRGHGREFAEEIFTDIEFFNRYGWNRAHAAAYGAVTYYTAWMKVHFPAYFMAELINSEDDPIRLGRLKGDCRNLGLDFDPVDVNKSQIHYTVLEPSKTLLPGFANVKGIGLKAAQAVIDNRQLEGRFYSKEAFRERVPRKSLNKTMFAALEVAGAFRDLSEVEAMEQVPF